MGYSQEVVPATPLQEPEALGLGDTRADASVASLLKAAALKIDGLAYDDLGTEEISAFIGAIEAYIAKKVADILKISFSRVDVRVPLNTLGIDSLMAVELKTTIEEYAGIEIPVEALFSRGRHFRSGGACSLAKEVGKRVGSKRRTSGKGADTRRSRRSAGAKGRYPWK